MKTMIFIVALTLLASCNQNQRNTTASSLAASDEIYQEVQDIADQFFAHRPMQGFNHSMTLEQAYHWQDRFAEYVRPTMGPVIGYKTGGHDPGPGFPTFPPEGIRGLMLEGMMLPSGTAITLDQTRRGFLEADFAFRVGSVDINHAQSDMELLAGLDAIVPFAEIPDPYYEAGTRSINGTIVANMGSRMSFVGEPLMIEATPAMRDKINTFTFAVHDENGVEVDTGTMATWYKPLDVVRWLRDHVHTSGKLLQPGQLLSLGNIGIIRQLHENSPRGPAYQSNAFILSYYDLSDTPISVTININRQ